MPSPLFTRPQDYHRPMAHRLLQSLASKLSGTTAKPSVKELREPLTKSGAAKLASALNQAQGSVTFTAKELQDPWSRKVTLKLRQVQI